MGIYIKGLKAPASCSKCRMGRWSNYYQHYRCEVCDREVAKFASAYNTSKPNWCPVTEVQEPHGALIDRDALNIGEYEREDDDTGTLEISIGGLLDLYHKIKNASTVIEGSENHDD